MSNGSVSEDCGTRMKFCEGWLEHKATRQNGPKYQKLWALMEDNVIYIFSTNKPSKETQLGNLTIDNLTVFTPISGGSPSRGFKFDLHTGNRVNRFKAKKASERELWRGYVVGISKGDVPANLDLLDSEIQQMRRDITAYHTGQPYNRDSIFSGDSGIRSLGPSITAENSSSGGDSRSTRSRGSGISPPNQGSPTVVHRFYNDHNRNQTPPSWFVSHCSREFAERLLERAVSLNYGNTLMRESTSYLSNGSYVISKIVISRSTGSVSYDHFEVIRSVNGYEVRVENPHAPMKCLSDVMDWFVRQAGIGTQPLAVNDLTVLGQDAPGYASKIAPRTSVVEPWAWPPAGPGEDGTEPMPDYDVPLEPPSPGAPSQESNDSAQHLIQAGHQAFASNTVSPGILRNHPSPGSAERKSVGWQSVIKTPPPVANKTFAGSRAPRDPTPSLSEIQQRTREADELRKFNDILDGFETGFQRDTIYVNLSDKSDYHLGPRTSTVTQVPPPAPHAPVSPHFYVNEDGTSGIPPPPAPHLPPTTPSYVNEGPLESDVALAELPVAPPAPRHPIVKPTASVLHTSKSASSLSDTSYPSSLRKSLPPAANPSGSGSSASGSRTSSLSKSVSSGQLKNLTSPNSPSSFPTWDNKKPSVISPQRHSNVQVQSNRNETVNASANKNDQTGSGVDENNPGGVSTLRNRFENSASKTPQGTPAARPDETECSGLDPSFKNRLEEMFKSGATVGPATSKQTRRVPANPTAHQHTREDHEYQELPEIVPDGVTYVNERYNVRNHDDT